MFFKFIPFYFKKLKFTPKLVLASQSPRRKELILKITSDFISVPSNADEDIDDNLDAFSVPCFLAEKKAEYVAQYHKENIVIGCDTVVILNGRVLGKPTDDDDAFKMLKSLSAQKHSVVTGCCIIKNGTKKVFSVKSEVWFKKLSDEQIHKYIKTGITSDKAGAYAIQSKGFCVVKKIQGDYSNIVGFPIKAIRKALLLVNK